MDFRKLVSCLERAHLCLTDARTALEGGDIVAASGFLGRADGVLWVIGDPEQAVRMGCGGSLRRANKRMENIRQRLARVARPISVAS
jgi:hypothetical protein